MLSSQDVSQMMAAQQAAFNEQNAIGARIGVAPPMMGLDAYGSAPHGGPFSFAQGGPLSGGYGGGNRFADTSINAAHGAIGMVGTGLGVASLSNWVGATPLLPSPIAHAFRVGGAVSDAPFAAGSMAGRALGFGGFGASALGFGATLGVGLAASTAVNSMMTGASQQGGIASTLGQNYNMFNSGSRTGMGFSRDDAQRIGDTVRQLANIPDMLTSVDQLTSIMGRLKTTGIMQGVKDASEFQHRFKDAIKTIRSVAEVLGTTMEEATGFFQHSSSVGLHGRSAMLQNALNVQFTSGVTGMSHGEVMGLQQTGANMATQMGAGRKFGTDAVTSLAQTLGAAQRSGALSNEVLQNATGLEGPEAINAGAQQIFGDMVKLGQTSLGQMVLLGLSKLGPDGKAMLDPERLAKFQREELSRGDLESHARSAQQTRGLAFSFKARQGDLMAQLASSAGGMSRLIGSLVEGKYGEEASTFLQGNYGVPATDSDLLRAIRDSFQSESEKQAFATVRGREMGIQDRYDPKRLVERVKTRLKNAVGISSLEQTGSEIRTALGRAYDDFVDDLVGRHVVTLSKEGTNSFIHAMASPNSKNELKKLFGTASAPVDTTPRGGMMGFLRDTFASLSGRYSTESSDEMIRVGMGAYSRPSGDPAKFVAERWNAAQTNARGYVSGAVRGPLDQLQRSLEDEVGYRNWQSMDPMERQKRLADRINGSSNRIISGVVDVVRGREGGDPGFIMAAGMLGPKNGVKFGGGNYYSVSAAAAKVKEADAALRGAGSGEFLDVALGGRQDLRDALSAMLSNSGTVGDAVRGSGSLEAQRRKLKEAGFADADKLTSEDMDRLIGAHSAVGQDPKVRQEAKAALDTKSTAEMEAGGAVLSQSFNSAATLLAATASNGGPLSAEIGAIAKGLGGPASLNDKVGQLQSNIDALVSKYNGTKSDKERAAMRAQAGGMRGVLEVAEGARNFSFIKRGKYGGMTAPMSLSDIEAKFHVGDSAAVDIRGALSQNFQMSADAEGRIRLSHEEVDRISKSLTRGAGAATAAGGGRVAAAGATDQTAINQGIVKDLQLIAQQLQKTGDAHPSDTKQGQEGAKPTAGAPDGTASPGSTGFGWTSMIGM